MRKSSLAIALNSISRAAKQQLTPSSKKDSEGQSRRQEHRRIDSASSSSLSASSFSDISESENATCSSEESRSVSRSSRQERRQNRRGSGHSRRKHQRRLRHLRRDHRHRPRHFDPRDDAEQMVELLGSLLPFYGTGDHNSDALVIDTIHRLPPHSLETHDHNGTTLLLLVCQFAAYDLLPTLLAKGCNVNASNNTGATPLHFACFSDTFSADSALTLIRHGALAEVAEHDWGCTPLHWAAFAGHVELCRALCVAGARPTTFDKSGKDAIYYAKQSGNFACTALLESFRGDDTGNTGNLRWERMIDGRTGSSFYHNAETGESIWGDNFRQSISEAKLGNESLVEPPVGNLNVLETFTIVTDAAEPTDVNENNENGILHIINDKLNEEPEPNVKSLVAIEARMNCLTDSKNSTPDRRSKLSFQSPHDDIVEVRSFAGDGMETIINDLTGIEEKQAIATQNIDVSTRNEEVYQGDRTSSVSSWDECITGPEDKTDKVGTAHAAVEHKATDVTVDVAIHEHKDKQKKSSPLPSRHGSFEERISILHKNMEHQLLDKLQLLEEKISQTQQKNAEPSMDESLALQEKIWEMTSNIMHLRTEIATKDLDVLKLKQKIIHLETSLEQSLQKPATACAIVGDGELSPHKQAMYDEELLSEKIKLEKELSDANVQIALIQEEAQQNSKLLAGVEEQLRETRDLLEAAERLAEKEKESSASFKLLLEQQSQNEGQLVESISTQTISEENQGAETSFSQLKEDLIRMQEAACNEVDSIRDEKEGLQKLILSLENRISSLENELTNAAVSHKAVLIELKSRHDRELDKVKAELIEIHREELRVVQEQLKDEQVSRRELEMTTNKAVIAMETAVEKSQTAEAALERMSVMISETQALQMANDQLHSSLQEETERRKHLHNTLEDMKGRIRVYVRIRPLSVNEIDAGYVNVMTKEDERTVVMSSDPATSTEAKDWEFDRVFNGSDLDGNTQEAIFNDTSLLLTSAIDGFNVCIFAYGQTGSGKTYTMFGGEDESQKGLAPRVAFELFKKLKRRETTHDIEVWVSMLELYTDKLNDLLVSKDNDENVSDLKIRLAEHTTSGLVEVEGAKVEQVINASELLDTLKRGSKSRVCSSTKMNADSSRSHMMATIVLSLRNKRTGTVVNGKLTLVDLAGSERVGKSGAAGHQLKEAQSINKSLSALGDVIGALTSGDRQHIPYRNHPLTMLMSDSIGGNAKTLMLVCCSPADYNRKETTNSLDFAKRCRNVTNNIISTNKGSSGSNINQIKALRAELSKIKAKEHAKQVIIKRRSAGMRSPGML
eukprot:CCRYP_006708-RA/>CCRYP_006708-RA protein AED:0.02 eAED:0.02 QI:472/1/1/1/1/1/3/175/1303